MTREELRDEYKKETGKSVLYHEGDYTDYYVEWLESQLCQPCKSCQVLQGQLEDLKAHVEDLKAQVENLKDHFNY